MATVHTSTLQRHYNTPCFEFVSIELETAVERVQQCKIMAHQEWRTACIGPARKVLVLP